ncbi:hypothetical protein CYMTET_49534 [Cymbomonas tetramitiformis]|uniref:Uncharacterized protein n=1 Tax=Cymbomonas tetramitiformis TaxID=36881 RepID=A0AAE0EUG1_9CHLO|nr:hypothetical protein CYMTET_49534 [Cymbomonas tetramitiformis]
MQKNKGDLEWKDLEDIDRVQDKIKDEVEEWSLSIFQDLLRRQSCPYSVYELKNFGIDLNAAVADIRVAESKKITTKQVPPPSNYSPKGRKPCSLCNEGYAHAGREDDCWVGGKNSKCPSDYTVSRINSARPDRPGHANKPFETLAKEIKDKLAQDMDDIKSGVSSSSASVRGTSDDEEEASRAAIQEEFEDVDEDPLSAAQGHVHVTLVSVKKIQGFTPMTPEEHQEGNPLRSASKACGLLWLHY